MMRARLCLITLLLAGTAASAHAEEGSQPARGPSLTVRGVGKYEVKPDYARFTATLTTPGKTLDATAEAHGPRSGQALAILKGLEPLGFAVEKASFGIDEWRRPASSGYYGQPAPKEEPPENPFTAKTTFEVKATAIDRLNEGVVRLAESGLFRVGGIVFKAQQERTALNEARRAAVIDARDQATVYAEAAELKLVEITAITDGEASPERGAADLPQPRFVQIIPPARIVFDASVNLTWRIAPR
jgi:uncharacterized protein